MARILVAEDHPDVRRLMTFALVEGGYEVATVSNGRDALDSILAEPPDLLVLDIMMPKMDGYDVLLEMKALGISDQIKVLVVTSKGSEHDWVRALELGADQYVTKPFYSEDLLEKVALMLSMSDEDVESARERELGRATLLSRLEAVFDSPDT